MKRNITDSQRERMRAQNRAWHKRNRERSRARHRQWVASNKGRVLAKDREWRNRVLYGLTPDQRTSLGWTCEICGAVSSGKRGLHIDHDHQTNDVRGLLCSRCNTALGLLKEDLVLVSRAFRYLSRFQPREETA